MNDRVIKTIRSISNLDALNQFEQNAQARNAITDEVRAAIEERSSDIGRMMISQRTGLDLAELSPAEEKIVKAVSTYVAIMKRQGKDASRTFPQKKRRGLIETAEIAVTKTKPTQGFQELLNANQSSFLFERIVVDHPDEFSPRAVWHARRALKLPNDTETAPTRSISPIQVWTEKLINWLKDRAKSNGGRLLSFSNTEVASSIGFSDQLRYARVHGNVQSRIDFACYRLLLPPLGLAANVPFEKAWAQQSRGWAFPVAQMQAAARARSWTDRDFDLVLHETERLPGQSYVSWVEELASNEAKVREWALGLTTDPVVVPDGIEPQKLPSARNPAWNRDELILALDLYLRSKPTPPGKESAEVLALSETLGRIARASGRTTEETFRNANGVYMKMMNFRRFDSEYTDEGKVGLTRGNKEEESVWEAYSANPSDLKDAVSEILANVSESENLTTMAKEGPYWVFVCNPKKWAIDKFLQSGKSIDTWGVRPSDKDRFAPGQLAVVRVGVDGRSKAAREGMQSLEPGIYALCEVESPAFAGTGANDEYWAPGTARSPGWPTVKVRYLKSYLNKPLLISSLRQKKPNLSPLLLNGFQASSL